MSDETGEVYLLYEICFQHGNICFLTGLSPQGCPGITGTPRRVSSSMRGHICFLYVGGCCLRMARRGRPRKATGPALHREAGDWKFRKWAPRLLSAQWAAGGVCQSARGGRRAHPQGLTCGRVCTWPALSGRSIRWLARHDPMQLSTA